MLFLRDFSALEIEKCIHRGFTVPQDATESPSSSVSSTENFSERNGVTGEFAAHGPAQELPFMEDAHLRHVRTGLDPLACRELRRRAR
jgi:hypothetical protein